MMCAAYSVQKLLSVIVNTGISKKYFASTDLIFMSQLMLYQYDLLQKMREKA